MKNKRIIIFLLLISLFTFSGCFDKKSEKTENNETNSEKEEIKDSITITDVKNFSYIRTIDQYITLVKMNINMGKYKTYDTSTLYLFPVGKADLVLESGDTSPYSKEWKYIFIGVTYDSSVYQFYVLALDGNNIGTDLITHNTLESESIDKIEEVTDYKELYNLSDNKEYTLDEMNSSLKALVNYSNKSKIKIYVK